MVDLDLNVSGKIEISGGYEDGTIDIEFEVNEIAVVEELVSQLGKEYLLELIEDCW